MFYDLLHTFYNTKQICNLLELIRAYTFGCIKYIYKYRFVINSDNVKYLIFFSLIVY